MKGVLFETTSTLASFMSEIAAGAATIPTFIVTLCNTIVETPFLLFTVVFLFVGGCVGIIGRLLSRN